MQSPYRHNARPREVDFQYHFSYWQLIFLLVATVVVVCISCSIPEAMLPWHSSSVVHKTS